MTEEVRFTASPTPSFSDNEDDVDVPESDRLYNAGTGGCSLNQGQGVKRFNDIPVLDRLVYPRGDKTDLLYVATSKPPGLVPTRYMPIWPELNPDSKIPFFPVPKGLFELSRGHVSDGLHRPIPNFTLTDPLNKNIVVTSPYNGLHDPNSKNLFHQPFMQKQITKNELVSPDGLVRCSLKEFNDYRRYLTERIYKVNLHISQAQKDKMESSQNEQLKRLKKDFKQTEANLKRNKALERVREVKEADFSTRQQKYKAKSAYMEFQAQAHDQFLQAEQAYRKCKGAMKEDQRKANVKRVREAVESRRKSYVQEIMTRENHMKGFAEAEKKRKLDEHNEYLLDLLSQRCEAQKQQIERAAEIKKTVAIDLKKKAARRRIKIETFEASLPERIAARRAEVERIWALVRKFFYRWLGNVRKRKARKPDELHRSHWEVQAEVEVTVKYLRKESGYEKFDDFIMNLVKLKRDIKAELETEEQIATAAALGIIESRNIEHRESMNVNSPIEHESSVSIAAPAESKEDTSETEDVD